MGKEKQERSGQGSRHRKRRKSHPLAKFCVQTPAWICCQSQSLYPRQLAVCHQNQCLHFQKAQSWAQILGFLQLTTPSPTLLVSFLDPYRSDHQTEIISSSPECAIDPTLKISFCSSKHQAESYTYLQSSSFNCSSTDNRPLSSCFQIHNITSMPFQNWKSSILKTKHSCVAFHKENRDNVDSPISCRLVATDEVPSCK